jgi:replicative superfamily II helicase
VRVLAAATTVAAGVNTPASSVIIAETEFKNAAGPVPFTVGTYKNMADGAGRLGYENEGKAIVLADTGMERDRLFARYLEGVAEPTSSSFDERALETWLIRLLAQVRRVTRDQAVEPIANTYGGYLANLARPGWAPTHCFQQHFLKVGVVEFGLDCAVLRHTAVLRSSSPP